MTQLDRIAMPAPPSAPPPFQFPLIATVAPVLASVVLWAITRSPLTLAFAALGPVIALASFADARLSALRRGRRDAARFAADLAVAGERIERAHAAERAALEDRHPDPARLLRRDPDPGRWSGEGVDVGVGRATLRSTLQLDAAPPEADALTTAARRLSDAPLVVDAARGVGVVGPAPFAAAVARGIALRLARSLNPVEWTCAAVDEVWAMALPHASAAPIAGTGVRGVRFTRTGEHGFGGGEAAVWAVPALEAVPAGCGTVIVVGDGGARIHWHPDAALRIELDVQPVGERDALRWASWLRDEAVRSSLAPTRREPPGQAELDLLAGGHGCAGALSAALGIGADGPFCVDLVADGPHAIVGGTTGSGKSELLVRWVLALAARYAPDEVAFLLVDFKGGAAFGPLAGLPHTTGTITDLDAASASRALASLRAEVRYRERRLADAGARDSTGVAGLGRLVIVVDEFAAMLAEHPELHGLFADLASRGRALGIHLVLCTQRPAAAVRDGVLANADLRISLRVNNRADSLAVIGSEAAANIPASARGRAYVSTGGGDPIAVQVALAAVTDPADVAARWEASEPARAPWLPPLPELVRLDELSVPAPGVVPFGLLDLPDEQARGLAGWHPARDGGLLVLGGPASGCTTALETIAHGTTGARWLPHEPEAAWDLVAALVADPLPGVLIGDDLDALVLSFGSEHRVEFIERLVRLVRAGSHFRLAGAMRRIPAELHALAALLPARLLLRHPSRHDLAHAGGDAAAHDPALPPGGGHWRGVRVQVATGAARRPQDPPAAPQPIPGGRPLAVATSRPAEVIAALSAAGYSCGRVGAAAAGERHATVGDVDEWLSSWTELAAARGASTFVLDGCSAADLRQLTRLRSIPPPLRAGEAWLIESGAAVRTRLTK